MLLIPQYMNMNLKYSVYEPKMLNKKLLWNAWMQTETKNKILQQKRKSMFTECETEMRTSEDVTACKNRNLTSLVKFKLTYI
jgi:hypothetical protein